MQSSQPVPCTCSGESALKFSPEVWVKRLENQIPEYAPSCCIWRMTSAWLHPLTRLTDSSTTPAIGPYNWARSQQLLRLLLAIKPFRPDYNPVHCWPTRLQQLQNAVITGITLVWSKGSFQRFRVSPTTPRSRMIWISVVNNQALRTAAEVEEKERRGRKYHGSNQSFIIPNNNTQWVKEIGLNLQNQYPCWTIVLRATATTLCKITGVA